MKPSDFVLLNIFGPVTQPVCLPDDLVACLDGTIIGTIGTNADGRPQIHAVSLGAKILVKHGSGFDIHQHELNIVLIINDCLGI